MSHTTVGSTVRAILALTMAANVSMASTPAYSEILVAFENQIKFGDAPRFVIDVTGNNPTGTVTINHSPGLVQQSGLGDFIPDYISCRAPVIDGKAVCVYETVKVAWKPGPIPGQEPLPFYWNVRVNYSGDANNPPSSKLLRQMLDTKPVRLGGVAVPNNPVAGQDVILSAVVDTFPIDGKMAFSRAGKAVAGCESVDVAGLPEARYSLIPGEFLATTGIATCTVKGIEAGNHSFDFSYASTNGEHNQSATIVFDVASSGAIPDHSGMYWNPAESGWGMSVVQHGDRQMNVIYGYDDQKAARWYVMPGGTWNAARTVYTGALYQPTSAPYDVYDAKAFKVNAPLGQAVLTYTATGKLTLAYTINGETASKELTKMSFGSTDTKTRLSVADMWWGGQDDAREYGWGVSIVQEGNVIYPVWFTYDAEGKSTWHALMQAPAGYVSYVPPVSYNYYGWYESRFISHMYAFKGSQAPSVNFDPGSLRFQLQGTVFLAFQDQENATFSHPVPCEGINTYERCTVRKSLKRQKF